MAKPTLLSHWKLVRQGDAPNPQGLSQRARAFTAAVAQCGGASLITTRSGVTLDSWVSIPSGGSADTAAIHLAHALSARAVSDPAGPLLDAPVVGWVEATDSVATRDSMQGVDPGEVSRRLAVSMRPGQWVGISLRAPARNELRRSHDWYQHRLGGGRAPTHHSWEDGAVVISVFAGGATKVEVSSLLAQVVSVLPGFDVGTRCVIPSPVTPVLAAGGLGLAAYGGAFYLSGDPVVANAAGLAPSLVAVGLASGRLSTAADRTASAVDTGRLPTPPKRRVPPSAPREANPNLEGSKGRASDGSYPLAPRSFLVGPTVPVGLVAPHAGAASGATATADRSVPEPLTRVIGPRVGQAVGSDAGVHLPAADGFAGVALLGQPGSGKSVLLRSIWGWNCLERVDPSGQAGWPGRRNAMVAFESKGDGAEMYRRWSHALGDRTLIVDFGDPASHAIDLFAVPGSYSERASWFTNALVYTFGPTDIGNRSFDVLQSVFTAALTVVDHPDVAAAAGVEVGESPVYYANILVGGMGDERGQHLATAIMEASMAAEAEAAKKMLGDGSGGPARSSDPVTPLGVAATGLAPLYGSGKMKVSDSVRRTALDPPRNKLGQIVGLGSWWSKDRRKITWDQVLDGHRSVVVNTGVGLNGQLVDDRATEQVSSLLMYSLKSAIQRRCSGWQSQGRSVSVFADELSLVAGASPEVIAWLRNQGRSYGVRAVFATQYPEQLDKKVHTAFMSFGTLAAFAQQNTSVADELATDLTLGADEWTGSDLKSLEPYHAIVRTSVSQHRQPAVAAVVDFFEDELISDPAGAAARFRRALGR